MLFFFHFLNLSLWSICFIKYLKTGLYLQYPFSRCPEAFKGDSWKLDKCSQTHDEYKSAVCELYFHKDIK